MKKKLLLILPVILVIAIAVCIFAFGKIGFCGDKALWVLHGNTLTVFGKGETDSFSEGDVPWSEYTDKITSVKISDGITSLGENIFSSHSAVKSILVSKSVQNIASSAFSNCTSIESIAVHEDNSAFCTDKDGVLFTEDMSTLILYPVASENTSYTVPDGVTLINYAAFSGAGNLSKINLPDSLTEISNHAFSYCNKLDKVVLPDGVTSLGTQSFYCCEALKSIVIPGSVKAVSVASFSLCSSLDDIYFVGTKEQWEPLLVEGNNSWEVPEIHFVTDYGTCGANTDFFITRDRTLVIKGTGRTDSFTQDSVPWIDFADKILSVSILDGVTGLGDYIFSGLKRVEAVAVPKSVTFIGTGAFDGFTKEQTINIEKSPKQSFASDWQSGCEAVINHITTE